MENWVHIIHYRKVFSLGTIILKQCMPKLMNFEVWEHFYDEEVSVYQVGLVSTGPIRWLEIDKYFQQTFPEGEI